jgi:hypothetical protein
LSEDQAKELHAGKVYVNVHTAANPGGEIRGQVARVSGKKKKSTAAMKSAPATMAPAPATKTQ